METNQSIMNSTSLLHCTPVWRDLGNVAHCTAQYDPWVQPSVALHKNDTENREISLRTGKPLCVDFLSPASLLWLQARTIVQRTNAKRIRIVLQSTAEMVFSNCQKICIISAF